MTPTTEDEEDQLKVKTLLNDKFQHIIGRALNEGKWKTFCRRLEEWTYVVADLAKKHQTDQQGISNNMGWQRRQQRASQDGNRNARNQGNEKEEKDA